MKNILVLSLLLLISACSGSNENNRIENGVSLALAQSRKEKLSDINYQLEFRIPDVLEQPIQAIEKLSFILADISEDLLLDFNSF